MQRRFKAKAPAVFHFLDLLSFNSESVVETTLDISLRITYFIFYDYGTGFKIVE